MIDQGHSHSAIENMSHPRMNIKRILRGAENESNEYYYFVRIPFKGTANSAVFKSAVPDRIRYAQPG